jgi:hypothetical protein
MEEIDGYMRNARIIADGRADAEEAVERITTRLGSS